MFEHRSNSIQQQITRHRFAQTTDFGMIFSNDHHASGLSSLAANGLHIKWLNGRDMQHTNADLVILKLLGGFKRAHGQNA